MKFRHHLVFCLLASATIAACFAGCSPAENKSATSNDFLGLGPPTPEALAFAKEHGATWITNPPLPYVAFTVDYQDGLFTQGATLACVLWVTDVQRKNGVLLLTGTFLCSIPGDLDFEVEITTNMLSTVRAARATGDILTSVRLAFRVESFNRIESVPSEATDSSEDTTDRYLIRGKAVAVEPIPETAMKQN